MRTATSDQHVRFTVYGLEISDVPCKLRRLISQLLFPSFCRFWRSQENSAESLALTITRFRVEPIVEFISSTLGDWGPVALFSSALAM